MNRVINIENDGFLNYYLISSQGRVTLLDSSSSADNEDVYEDDKVVYGYFVHFNKN